MRGASIHDWFMGREWRNDGAASRLLRVLCLALVSLKTNISRTLGNESDLLCLLETVVSPPLRRSRFSLRRKHSENFFLACSTISTWWVSFALTHKATLTFFFLDISTAHKQTEGIKKQLCSVFPARVGSSAWKLASPQSVEAVI